MADDPQLTKLDEIIDSGVKSIFADGERVEFQDTTALLKARAARARRSQRAPGPIRLIPTCRR